MDFRRKLSTIDKLRFKNTLNRVFHQPGFCRDSTILEDWIGGYFRTPFNRIIDRTKKYNCCLVSSPLPDFKINKPFETCMEERAEEIKRIARIHNLTTYCLWSGGLDSTGVFYALLNTGMEFKVLFEPIGYEEYPKLGDEIIAGKFPGVEAVLVDNRQIEFPEYTNERNDVLFITGECGDQVFGALSLMHLDKDQRNVKLKDCIGNDRLPEDFYELTMPSVSKIIGEDPKLSEYIWCLNFVYKYMKVALRMRRAGLRNFGPDQNTIHFFENDDFQVFAMNNYHEHCAFNSMTDYKLPLKEYILAQNKDYDYFNNKGKEFSMKKSELLRRV